MKTIYLEVDEEITSVIDKIKKTDDLEVALVIPKGAPLTQSIVNIKLLQKEAEALGKNISLVTADKVGRTLANQVGIPVYHRLSETKTPLQEETPDVSEFKSPPIEIQYREKLGRPKEKIREVIIEKDEVGKFSEEAGRKEDEEHREAVRESIEGSKSGKTKKISFRSNLGLKLIGGIILFLVLGSGALGAYFLPKAKVIITPKTETESLNFQFNLDKNLSEADLKAGSLPAKIVSVEKESAKKFPATGKKTIGEKATGIIRLTGNKSEDTTFTLGTIFYGQTSGKNYLSTKAVTLPKTVPPYTGTYVDIPVKAQDVGDSYNLTNTENFKISGDSELNGQNIGAFTGGSSREVSVVSTQDIEKNGETLFNELSPEIESDLTEKIESGYRFIKDLSEKEIIEVLSSPKEGEEASEFELRVKARNRTLAFIEEDLKKLAEDKIKDKLSGREIIDLGLSNAGFILDKVDYSSGTATLSLKTNVFLGKKIDQEKLKNTIVGKGKSTARKEIGKLEDIQSFRLEVWPGFYPMMPFSKDKIEIKIEVKK